MHATIWCDVSIEATQLHDTHAGRALGSKLTALPGFVAYVALATETGGISAICICEDEQSLAEANDVIAAWNGAESTGQAPGPAPIRTGEVIVQKGL
jgi:hypothetical protein